MIEIKHKISGEVLWTVEADTLERVDLQEAILEGADLSHMLLRNAQLQYADLSDADLSDVDLRGANLVGAHLVRTNLRNADLRGAKFRDGTTAGGGRARGKRPLWGESDGLRHALCGSAQSQSVPGRPVPSRFAQRESTQSKYDLYKSTFILAHRRGLARCGP